MLDLSTTEDIVRPAQLSGCPQRDERQAPRLARVLLAIAVAVSLMPMAVPPAGAAPGDPVLYEQSDARFGWSGAWLTGSASGPSGGTQAFTNVPGASVTFDFFGTQFDLMGMVGPKSGIASVSLDGGMPVDVDFYAAETAFAQTVFSASALSPGLHTLTVTCTGTNQASAGDSYVSVDAVRVSGELVGAPVEQTDVRIVKRGAWSTSAAAGLSGGSQMLTNVGGAEVVFAFTGTQLDLVGTTGPKFGIASVSIDGGAPVDVDLYAVGTAARQRVFSTGALPSGAHTVRVTCSGRKNAAADDTYVAVDAVLPVGTLTQAFMRYEETEPKLAWNGQLTAAESAVFSGGRYLAAGPGWGAGAVSFVGSQLTWIGVTGPDYGVATVSVDGAAPARVDLYSADLRCRQAVWSSGPLAYGQHTVTISWSGQRNPASAGSYVSFDAFDIAGEPVQAPVPQQPVTLQFNYPWTRYIVVDKSDLRLYYVIDGVLVRSYVCATGKPSTPTPSATWRIDAKYYPDPTSVYGPRKMRLFRQQGGSFVYTAYGIHGTNVDSSIGTYASHGCIRLHNYDIIELFDMVPLGTMVVTRD